MSRLLFSLSIGLLLACVVAKSVDTTTDTTITDITTEQSDTTIADSTESENFNEIFEEQLLELGGYFEDVVRETEELLKFIVVDLKKIDNKNETVQQHLNEFVALLDVIHKLINEDYGVFGDLSELFAKVMNYLTDLEAKHDTLTKDDAIIYEISSKHGFGMFQKSLLERLLELFDDFAVTFEEEKSKLTESARETVDTFLLMYNEVKNATTEEEKWDKLIEVKTFFLNI